MTLLGVAPSVLPTPLADIGLAVVSSNTAKTIAFAAWGAHVVEGAIAAVSVSKGGGDARAAAWWGAAAFLFGFPALLMAQASVKRGD